MNRITSFKYPSLRLVRVSIVPGRLRELFVLSEPSFFRRLSAISLHSDICLNAPAGQWFVR